MQQGRLC